ncbi:MAG: PAN domain-containing protein [Candidatus Sulfotelmatobacter sp.]
MPNIAHLQPLPFQRTVRLSLLTQLLGLAFFLLLCPSSICAQNFEPNTDRYGMDIRDFDLPSNSLLCYNACRDDQRCRAFTFKKPPAPGAPAHCWIKSGIPAARFDRCCVSGVVRPEAAVRPPNFEPNTDRFGMDIRDFDLPANSLLCYNACRDDQSCRSFTYKKPPAPGAPAHCWIKSGIPGASYDPAFVSGIVR